MSLNTWKYNNNQIKLTGTMHLSASAYVNWGADSAETGSSGYGIRDNGGQLQFKNLTGSWSNLVGDDLAGIGLAANYITTGDAAVSVATSAGNITIDAQGTDTDIIFKGTDDGSDITMLTLDGSEAGAATFNGPITCATSFTIGSAAMSEADLEQLDGITAGTAAASKAVVLDASKNIATIGTVGCGAITSTGTSTFGGVNPASADGAALGGASAEWSDLYLANGAKIYFGDDQEVTLTHSHDSGLVLTHSGSSDPVLELLNSNADATGATLKLHMSSASPADADVLGNVDFAGYDSAGNEHTYARILAKSDDVTTGEEEGSLEFYVAELDGTLSKGMDIKGLASDGNITVDISTHDGSAGGLKLGGTLVTATAAELNFMDGGSTISTVTVADGDGVVFNDGTAMKQVTVQSLAAYFDDEITAMPNLVTTAATTVGTLNSGAISSGFGNIDNGSSTLDTGVATVASLTCTAAATFGGGYGDTGTTISTAGVITSNGACTVGGVLKTDDTTNATSTTDGSLQTDGGLSVALDVIVGDDVYLLSDSAVLGLGAGKDATLTHDGTTGLTIAANPITLDSGAGLVLDAANGEFELKVAGTEIFMFEHSNSGDVTLLNDTSDKDMIFKITDGGSETEVFRLDGDVSAMTMASGKRLQFADTGEYIVSDGTNLTIESGGSILMGATVSPDSNGGQDLGASGAKWDAVYANNVYTGDLHLKNERGDWSVIEESDYLTLRHNTSGKRFKLLMEELSDGEFGPGNDGVM